MRNNKIVVSGGCGFLGSTISNKLSSLGYNVIVIDNLSTGKSFFIRDEIVLKKVDITSFKEVNQLVIDINPSTFIHLAAIHHIPTCNDFPYLAYQTNILGTLNILESLNNLKDDVNFLFASTGGVYDQSNTSLLKESSHVNSNGIYENSKICCENIIKSYSDKRILPTIFRFFNLIGANETNDHLLPAILNQLLINKKELGHGNLSPKRDYLHILDAANLVIKWVKFEEKQALSKIFNVCSNIETSVADVIDLCMNITQVYPKLFLDKKRLRKIDRPSQIGDNSLAINQLNWKVEHNLKNGILDLWNSINLNQQKNYYE